MMDGLGISPEDRQLLVNEVDVVINCAASINFDDPLLDALQINYFGCLRLLNLAKECKNITTFTHVSTAYVNSNLR
jgi:fatty acyl-CoA reductase